MALTNLGSLGSGPKRRIIAEKGLAALESCQFSENMMLRRCGGTSPVRWCVSVRCRVNPAHLVFPVMTAPPRCCQSCDGGFGQLINDGGGYATHHRCVYRQCLRACGYVAA